MIFWMRRRISRVVPTYTIWIRLYGLTGSTDLYLFSNVSDGEGISGTTLFDGSSSVIGCGGTDTGVLRVRIVGRRADYL